jgi:hypothetical protein
MLRQLAILIAAAALAGCATDYSYRGGAGGDYYYGRPSVEYYDYGYGAPYGSAYGYPGSWYGGVGIGYGYGYGYGGYGYPYGYYGGGYYPPYWWYRPHRPHHPHKPPQDDAPPRVTGGRLPPSRVVGSQPPRSPAQVVPRNGQRPMLPPPRGEAPWRGRADAGPPPMSRPAPQAVRPPASSPRPVSAPRPAPPVSGPSRPTSTPTFREREPDRKRER